VLTTSKLVTKDQKDDDVIKEYKKWMKDNLKARATLLGLLN
jgi:hypothetical protein